MTTKSNLVGNL